MSNTFLTNSCYPFLGGILEQPRWDKFHRSMNEIEALQLLSNSEDCERVFTSGHSNVKEEDDRYIVEAIIPGVAKEDLNVEFKENILSITSKLQEEEEEEEEEATKKTEHCYEYKFYMNNNIDNTKITAELSRGILTLTLPKKESEKPQLIEIQEQAS